MLLQRRRQRCVDGSYGGSCVFELAALSSRLYIKLGFQVTHEGFQLALRR